MTDPDAVARAAEGRDVVFHVAAKAGIWGPTEEYQRINVEGTRHVLNACRKHGVGRLVHTSSPSVVFNGRDMEGADESAPYPKHFDADYPRTKAEAEREVLAANGPDLATVALRPHLIWGPGDNHLVPRIVARARAGRLRRIGRENQPIDATYIDNAAEAHILAADRLAPGSAPAGRAYFIAQGEPVPVWDLVNRILKAAGLPPVTRTVPTGVALAAAGLLESAYRTFGIHAEPPLTRFFVHQVTTAHWFDLTAARRDLGYSPRVSTAEGLERLRDWFLSS
ncbi:MAG: NAD-dependent epimerase/dehydratase family protein [Isosphaeraceae bacterium]